MWKNANMLRHMGDGVGIACVDYQLTSSFMVYAMSLWLPNALRLCSKSSSASV